MVSAAIGDVWIMAANALVCLGGVAMDLEDYREAESHLEQGLRWYEELERGGYPWSVAYACTRLGEVALSTQDYPKAQHWLQQSLGYLHQAGREPDRLYYEALLDVAKLFAAQARTEDAVEILSCLSHIEYSPQDQFISDLATASLVELQSSLPGEIYMAALERGKALYLDTVDAKFLET